ncbi:opioid-binding cell adhesion molecule isoform X4 [Paramuricea clavata]|uniref:Opioid-binding cell adhesion molecule isoform X4 n=1 Tax=Paramuricea clavata TaxID=317549 RepID=A0A6S7JAB4_PARCT|nr:opioid-binding cell adhesion molecule isoform X4 [Paramuricea clavata]
MPAAQTLVGQMTSQAEKVASQFHYISENPTVTLSCSSPVTVNEGDNVTCICRGKGGNPSANVTWYDKGGVQIVGTGKEEQTLTLSNVVNTASGTYKCVAKSHTLTDEKSIEIIVYNAVPPTVISLRSTPENVVFGESIVITCEASCAFTKLYHNP